jgi:formylglycine-generating enzyme required for sulfatase activity
VAVFDRHEILNQSGGDAGSAAQMMKRCIGPGSGSGRRSLARLALLLAALPVGFSAEAVERVVPLVDGVSLRFVRIAPGTFVRGSPASEPGRDRDEGPVHEVTLTHAFYLGVHEVTQAQWTAVMGSNPAVFKRGPDAPRRPVESVSWEDGQRFLARLNTLGVGRFRLPTEAEWEYAARAGSSTRFPWGDDPKEFVTHAHAWANSRSYAITHPVGEKPPNAWGLFDLHGNVWEWCSDWYGPYPEGPQRDPVGPPGGRERVFRGGSWYDFPVSLRSANRHRHVPDGSYTAVGLRLVWQPGESP